MTKPQDPPNRSKVQAFQLQAYCQAALLGRGRIGFMGNCIEIVARFAFVALAAVEDDVFDSGCSETSWTIAHLHIPEKNKKKSVANI